MEIWTGLILLGLLIYMGLAKLADAINHLNIKVEWGKKDGP